VHSSEIGLCVIDTRPVQDRVGDLITHGHHAIVKPKVAVVLIVLADRVAGVVNGTAPAEVKVAIEHWPQEGGLVRQAKTLPPSATARPEERVWIVV
jgi:hypothetical protein